MQTTISTGWQAKVSLPSGEKHVWRIYEHQEGHAGQAQGVQAFVTAFAA
jgi:hypothetical protein